MNGGKVRVLLVENIAVEAAHRHVYRELAKHDELEVHLLVPPQWMEAQKLVVCEPENDPRLHLHISNIFFNRQHRVIYRDLGRILQEVRPQFIFLDQEPENYAAVQGIYLRRKYAPAATLALVSSRNIDHVALGFPYKAEYIHRQCDRFVARNPVDVCFVRTQAAEPFMHAYAKEIVHLPFPIETSRLKKVQPVREGPASFTIGYVGRLIEPKGVQLLFDLMPTFPDYVRMLFVGKGSLGEKLSLRARELGLGDRLTIRSPVPHSEIPNVFSEMDVVVVPSLDTKFWKEQCPRVPMEAMACEMPVIGSDSGGIPEALGNAGLLFEQGNSQALRDAIMRVIEDVSLREKLAVKGRERVLEYFQVSVIAQRMAETILRCVHGKRIGKV